MDAISVNDTAYAIRETFEVAGRSIDSDALEIAATKAGGFAFPMQLIGYHLYRQLLGERAVTKQGDAIGDAPDSARKMRLGANNASKTRSNWCNEASSVPVVVVG